MFLANSKRHPSHNKRQPYIFNKNVLPYYIKKNRTYQPPRPFLPYHVRAERFKRHTSFKKFLKTYVKRYYYAKHRRLFSPGLKFKIHLLWKKNVQLIPSKSNDEYARLKKRSRFARPPRLWRFCARPKKTFIRNTKMFVNKSGVWTVDEKFTKHNNFIFDRIYNTSAKLALQRKNKNVEYTHSYPVSFCIPKRRARSSFRTNKILVIKRAIKELYAGFWSKNNRTSLIPKVSNCLFTYKYSPLFVGALL